MINSLTEVFAGVDIYHCDADTEKFKKDYWEESKRTWSYLPFFKAVSQERDFCDSHYSPLEPLMSTHTERIQEIKDGFLELNDVVEKCLTPYSLHYEIPFIRDSGAQVIYLKGNQFSKTINPPGLNDYATLSLMALSDVCIRLERHDLEFDISSGDVLIMPCNFPFDLRIKPSQNGEAFLLTKYLWPR